MKQKQKNNMDKAKEEQEKLALVDYSLKGIKKAKTGHYYVQFSLLFTDYPYYNLVIIHCNINLIERTYTYEYNFNNYGLCAQYSAIDSINC